MQARVTLCQRLLIAGCALVALAPTPAPAQILLIGNKGEDTLSLVDIASGEECVRLPTGKAPHEIAVSPDGRKAAVVGYGAATIDVFDIRRRRLLNRFDLGTNQGPHGIVWLSSNRLIAVTDRANSLVSLDPRTGRYQSIPTGQRGSHMVAVSRDLRLAYVSNILSGTVGIFDLERWTKLSDIAVGGNPEALSLSADGTHLWVGDNSGPRVKIVDLVSGRIDETLESDSVSIRLAASPNGAFVVASGFLSGSLTLFDARSRRRLRSIPVSGDRRAMQVTLAWSNRPGRIFVAETGRDRIAEVDLRAGRVLRRITAGKNGDGLAIAPGSCRQQTK